MFSIKKLFLGAAFMAGLSAGAGLLQGCEKVECDLCRQKGEKHHVTLDVGGAAIRTKVRGVTMLQESVVRSCRLYVFTQEGYQINNWQADDGLFDFYLTDGIYEFVAVVNLDGLPGTDATRDDLFDVVVPIERNTIDANTGGFVMVGRLEDHVIQGDEKITVEVRRLVSKVSYTVRTAFEGNMAKYPFVVDAIYMTNVAGETNLGLTEPYPAIDGPWYNKMNFDAADTLVRPYPAEMLYGAYHKEMANGDSLTTGHTFYVYPNASEDCRDTTAWQPRCTRFVVRATVNGTPTYYAVTLNPREEGVKSNKHYHLDVTIKGWGTDHPEVNPDDLGTIESTFRIEEWKDSSAISEEF